MRKATVSLVIYVSVRLSVRMEQFGSPWADFEIWVFFENLSGNATFMEIW